MSDDLAAWLTQIWDEDEAVAVAAPGRSWTAFREADVAGASVYDEQWVLLYPQHYDHDRPLSAEPGATGPAYIERARDELCAHIARYDPAAVLARIAADRQILVEHSFSENEYFGGDRRCVTCAADYAVLAPWPCLTVRLLALPYAGRPGYREEWRP